MALKEEWLKEKKKLSRMTWGQKIEYIIEYYKFWILGIVLVVGVLTSVISTIVSHKPNGFYAMMLNAGSGNETANPEQISKEFGEVAGIDTNQYDVTIDASESYNPHANSEFTMAMTARISGLFATHGLDVMVEDPTVFYYYVVNGAYTDLREIYQPEDLERYKDRIYYVDEAEIERIHRETDEALAEGKVPEDPGNGNGAGETATEETNGETSDSLQEYATGIMGTPTLISREDFHMPDPETMEKPVPVGLVLTDSPKLSAWGYYRNTVPILGFPADTLHQSEAKQYVDWLLREE